jgi:hypothetical protein
MKTSFELVAEFRENLGGIDGPAAGEALDQWAIGVLGQCGRDGGGELLELSDKRREDGDQGLDEFPAGLGLRVVGTAQGSAAQAGEQLGRGAPAAVGMALEELSEAVLAEPLSTGRRRVAGEEGQGDRGVHLGEDGRGAGPEALEQGAELVGEGHALSNEVVAAADEGPEGAGLVREGLQGPEAVAIGPEQVSEEVGVAGIALAPRGRVAGPARLDDVGVDGDDGEAGAEEGVDDEARGTLEGDRQAGGGAEAPQVLHESREPGRGVGHRAAPADRAGLVDHTDRVRGGRPVQADEVGHCAPLWDCETLRRERSRRSLTDWRSGLQVPVALHPVAGWGLSGFDSGERVSCWPSCGEPTWLSPNPETVTAVSIRSEPPHHQEARSPRVSRIEDLGPTHISIPPGRALSLSSGGRVGQ